MIDAHLEPSKGGTRRIMAVLMSDVYGYTNAVGHQEEVAVSRVKEDLADFAKIIAAHNGQVVADRGDGVKAVFDSGVDALRAALKMQSLILQKNAKLGPDALRVRHRVGIHVGDVIVSDDRYTGLAVAIAARLETLCPPGKIAFTDTVHEMTRQTLHFDRSYMGQYEVKNVAHPVRVWVGRIPGDLDSIAMPASAVVAGKRKEIVIQQKSYDGFWRAITVVTLLAVVAAVGLYLQKMVLADETGKDKTIVPPKGSTGTVTRPKGAPVSPNSPTTVTPGNTGGGGSKASRRPEQSNKANSPTTPVKPPVEKPKVDSNAATDEDTLQEIYNLPGGKKKEENSPPGQPAGGNEPTNPDQQTGDSGDSSGTVDQGNTSRQSVDAEVDRGSDRKES